MWGWVAEGRATLGLATVLKAVLGQVVSERGWVASAAVIRT